MGDYKLSRAGIIGLYGGIAAAVLFLVFMAGWIGMTMGAATDDVEPAAQTQTEEPELETMAPEPTVSLSLPTEEPREPMETPEAIETPLDTVEVPDQNPQPPEQERSPAILAPPAPPVRPAPEVEMEPQFECPAGQLLVWIDEATISEPVTSSLTQYEYRDVNIYGTAVNNSNEVVELDLYSGPTVYAIDSQGEMVDQYFTDFDYTPEAGTQRPFRIDLGPQEYITFTLEAPETIGTRENWLSITHLVLDEHDGPLASYRDYWDMPPRCDDIRHVLQSPGVPVNLD